MKNNENEHQTNRVFNSEEKKPQNLLKDFFLIIGGIFGYLVLSVLIAAVLVFVALYIVCGGEFGIKW